MQHRIFDASDYDRMAKELEAMADLIDHRPEKNTLTAARLKVPAEEMRADSRTAFGKKT